MIEERLFPYAGKPEVNCRNRYQTPLATLKFQKAAGKLY